MVRQINYDGLHPGSPHATSAAKAASKHHSNALETKLRRALWEKGLRYRKNVDKLPGKPDIVFLSKKIAIFCDGDFWHGRDWEKRKRRLAKYNNAHYWLSKISSNMERDLAVNEALKTNGWTVLRFWESDIKSELVIVVDTIQALLND